MHIKALIILPSLECAIALLLCSLAFSSNPDMRASGKHFRVHAPHSHDTQTKLKVFQSSALALNRIGNLEIPFNSPKLTIF